MVIVCQVVKGGKEMEEGKGRRGSKEVDRVINTTAVC